MQRTIRAEASGLLCGLAAIRVPSTKPQSHGSPPLGDP
jgi:hypothetical protein